MGRIANGHHFFEVYPQGSSLDIVAKKDLKGFSLTATRCFKTNVDAGLKASHKLVSHLGALRVPVCHFANRSPHSHCRRVGVTRERHCVMDNDGVSCANSFHMLYDSGNVAYTDFLKALITYEEYIELFKTRNEESAEGM